MSIVLINAALILDGNIACNGNVQVTLTGVVTVVPDPDLKKSVYSYKTNSYTTSNGVGRSITTTEGGIDHNGLIKGAGFDSDEGPGNNSLGVNSLDNLLIGYGATHAGLGAITPAPGTTVPLPKPVYGFYESPVSLGSGGGYYHPSNVFYGTNTRGGGAIKLVAKSGVISLDGTINMDGESGYYTGGGAGGSIWVIGWYLVGSGTLSVKGGSCSTFLNGGGGGGGYISLWYENANQYNGPMSIDGGNRGGGEGKIFVKQIEPVIEERFTGTIWNTKWWTYQNTVSLNNALRLSTEQDVYNIPSVESVFNVSGKNITAAVDYLAGAEIPQYDARFLLYVDSFNWVGLTKKSFGVFGISSVDGVISSSGVPLTNVDMSMRLVKTDSTFSFQYYDSTSMAPLTIYSDIRPELADKAFKIRMELEKPSDSTVIKHLRLTPYDISHYYTYLDGTPADLTSVAFDSIGSGPQFYGVDFTMSGNKLSWDMSSSDLSGIFEVGDVIRTIYSYPMQILNGMDASFNTFRITEGVVRGAETTEPVIYVDPDFGSDSSDGRQLSPMKNLFVATAWAKKGGTVVLYDGTYNPTYVARKDITIRGAEGVKPLITSRYSQDTTGSGWENNALSFYSCQGLVENVQIADSTVGIRVENTDKFIVNRNLIHDVSTAISFVKCDPSVTRNRIYNANTGIDFTTCKAPYINSNLVHDSSVGFHAGNTAEIDFVGNTIDACDVAVFIDSSSDGIVSSNSLTNCNVGYQVSTDSSVPAFFNNFYNNVIDMNREPDGTAGNINMNPLYLNRFGPPAYKDYHLDANSPNIGSGESLFDDTLIDFDGVSRV